MLILGPDKQTPVPEYLAGIGTWQCDLETRIVSCSDKTCEIFGFWSNQVSLDKVFETIHEEDRQRVQSAVENALTHPEGLYHAEYRVFNQLDNTLRYVIGNGKVFFDEDGNPFNFIGTSQDVTKEHKAQQSLMENEERFRHLFESTPISIFEEDFSVVKQMIDRLKADGVTDMRSYLTANPQVVAEMFGSVRICDVNSTALQLLEAESLKELKDNLAMVVVDKTYHNFIEEAHLIAERGGGRYEYETMLRTFKGNLIHVLVHIDFPLEKSYSSVLVSLTNISRIREAETALRQNETAFRTLANAMPQLVWIADEKGTVTYYNDRVSEYAGARKNDEGHWEWGGLLHPDDTALTIEAWSQAVATGKPYQAAHRVQMKDGAFRWHLSRAFPQLDENGKVLKWFGTATDIHAAKAYAEELEREVKNRTSELESLNQSLQRSNLELQQFAHVASHDLKEPLRKIKTFAGRLADDQASVLSEKGALYLSRIGSAVNRMFVMIEGVLNYSVLNASTATMEQVDLKQVVSDIVADLDLPINESGARIQMVDLPAIEGIPVLIYQLFYNLFNNSLKFAKSDTPPVIDISYQTLDNGNIEIRMQDNGIGFRQEFAETIFETFARLNPKDHYEGTGLGLALCKRIAERHHGHIRAEGKDGEGAAFIVQLPLRQQPVETKS